MKFLKVSYKTLNLSILVYSNILNFTVPVEIINTNERSFIYDQLNSHINKNPYQFSENCKFVKKLISLNSKRGYKLKAAHLYSGVLNYIYGYFESFDFSLDLEYSSYKSFFEFSRNFPHEFYKPDFLIRYIHLYLELIFLLKKVQPKKKLKKKKQIPKILVSYIPNITRSNITLRIINAYLNNSTIYNNVIRVGNSILYLALSGKNSFLYKKKLSMYNKLLEKKKFY